MLNLKQAKPTVIFFAAVAVILALIICVTNATKSDKPRLRANKDVEGLNWELVGKESDEQQHQKSNGKQLTLNDVLWLSKKGEALSWKNLKKYNYYEKIIPGIYSSDNWWIYEIEELEGLFELQVKWSYEQYPVHKIVLEKVLLTANDGQNLHVDIRTEDVEAYIKEHKVNPVYRDFDFSYFPVEAEGTAESLDMFTELMEAGEEFIISGPDEIAAVKIDSKEELYAFVEKMQPELKYADAAIANNVYHTIGKRVGKNLEEPQFIMYIPKGNRTHEYHVVDMKRNGENLYISIEKSSRKDSKVTLDGGLIGLGIQKDKNDMSTVKGVTKVYIDIIPIQYESIESVKLRLGYPPYTGYTLTTAEINDFIGCLEKIDFAEYEPEKVLPDGDAVECFITADEKLHRISFLKPYIRVAGNLYEIGMEQEIFEIVEKIIANY